MPGDATRPAFSGSSRGSRRRGQTKGPRIIAWNPRAPTPASGLAHPPSPPRAAAGFPSGCDQGGGKDRGRSKEPGREAGGWGGAGDQVIRRIINLDGSLGEKKLWRLPDAGKEPEKAGRSSRQRSRTAARTLPLAAPNCGSQGRPALAAVPGCPPQRPPWGGAFRLLGPVPATSPGPGSSRAPTAGTEDPEAVRPEPRRALSAARAAPMAAGEEVHASREAQGPGAAAAAAARLGKS